MKRLLFLAIALLTLSIARADDIADAKAAFATLLEYQKTDDIRSLELFTEDCAVTFAFTDGVKSREATISSADFREMLKQAIALKQGNRDVYQDVKFTKEQSGVRVTSKILYAESGKRGSFSALYIRDKDSLKIKEMKVTDGIEAASSK